MPTVVAISDAIANHAPAQRSRQLGREVAHLIGVRHENQIGLGLRDGLGQRQRKTVRSVFLEQVVLDQQHFGPCGGRQLIGKRANAFAGDSGGQAAAGFRGNLLRGGQGLKAGRIPLAFALFGDDQDIHCLECLCRAPTK